MNKKQETTFLARVKERVDFIYGLLIECPEGYHGGLHQDGLTNEVTRALIKRGVVKRDKDNTRARLVYIYKWVAALAPTKTLYTNIMVDVRDARKEYYGKARDKKQKKEQRPIEMPDIEKMTGLPKEVADATGQTAIIKTQYDVGNKVLGSIPVIETEKNPLKGFTDKELWEELKRRGYTPEGSRLVITRKEYLE